MIDRAKAHMSSASNLAANKIDLYFRNLKLGHLYKKQDLESLDVEVKCEIKTNTLILRKGKSCPTPVEITKYKSKTLYPFGASREFFFMKDERYVWIFNSKGIFNLLSERVGFGETGEIYLVGSDSLMKSASRFLDNVAQVSVRNKNVERGLQNESGVDIVPDYRGVDVISAYRPVHFDELDFVVLSEIDYAEVLAPLRRVLEKLLFICSLLIVLSSAMALYLTRSTVKIINKMQHEIDSLNLSSALNIIRAQEGTREKISLHLHDSVGQYLTALKWEVTHLMMNSVEAPIKQKLAKVSEICDAIFKEIRSISSDLMPTLIRDFGCFTAIENFLKEQLSHYPLQISYENKMKIRQEELKHEFQLNLYRMVQEFMQNTVKHSHARSVSVSFFETDKEFVMTFEDDGIGMPYDNGLPKSLSYRTQLFNGKMQRIETHKGLKFKVSFNLEEVKDESNRSLSAG